MGRSRLGLSLPHAFDPGDSVMGRRTSGLYTSSPGGAGSFELTLATLNPFAWWKMNDTPASGTVLDYGNTHSPLIAPAAPPHNLSLPAHLTSVPGWTRDGHNGLGWDGVNQARMDWAGAANNDLPQGQAWSFLFVNRSSPGDGAQTIFGHCAGLGLDTDGKASFIVYTGAGAGGNQMLLQCTYFGGANVTAFLTDARFNDGSWHMYVINVHSATGPAQTMTYDLYIDGAFVTSTTINSNGISFFYDGSPGTASLPDGFHVGGYSPNIGVNGRTKGALQHHAIFLGAVSPFGPMLTPTQIATLYASR